METNPTPATPAVTHEKEIIRLMKFAEKSAGNTRRRAVESVDAAIKCGQLLCEEKDTVQKSHQKFRGFWIDYYNAKFERILPLRTAQRWMRLSNLVIDGKTPKPNIMRIGVLALGMMPAKVHPAIPGDAKLSRIPPSHLSFINRFNGWRRDFETKHVDNILTDPERAQLKADFRVVIDFIRKFALID